MKNNQLEKRELCDCGCGRIFIDVYEYIGGSFSHSLERSSVVETDDQRSKCVYCNMLASVPKLDD